MATQEERDRIRNASQRSRAKASGLLDAEIQNVMNALGRVNELKPKTTDDITYNKLIKMITEANEKNIAIATLKENIQKLGSPAVLVFKKIASIAGKLK